MPRQGPGLAAQARVPTQPADRGRHHLLRQLRQLQNLPPELAGRQQDVDAYVNKVLDDPKAHLAISLALQQKPELATGGEGQATLNFFTRVKLGDQGRRLGRSSPRPTSRATCWAS